jgi:hypothetical protein
MLAYLDQLSFSDYAICILAGCLLTTWVRSCFLRQDLADLQSMFCLLYEEVEANGAKQQAEHRETAARLYDLEQAAGITPSYETKRR